MKKKLIQYYDELKPNQISVEDLAIDVGLNLPIYRERFGEDNVAIYCNSDTKEALKTFGIDCDCIKVVQPLDDLNHSVRWLSIMAQQTEPFQICPVGLLVAKRDDDVLEVSQLIEAPYIPILNDLGIEQTGGICGSDIINIPNCYMSRQAYSYARNIIQDKIENEIEVSEYECSVIMGAMLYKVAKEMNITIEKYP